MSVGALPDPTVMVTVLLGGASQLNKLYSFTVILLKWWIPSSSGSRSKLDWIAGGIFIGCQVEDTGLDFLVSHR